MPAVGIGVLLLVIGLFPLLLRGPYRQMAIVNSGGKDTEADAEQYRKLMVRLAYTVGPAAIIGGLLYDAFAHPTEESAGPTEGARATACPAPDGVCLPAGSGVGEELLLYALAAASVAVLAWSLRLWVLRRRWSQGEDVVGPNPRGARDVAVQLQIWSYGAGLLAVFFVLLDGLLWVSG